MITSAERSMIKAVLQDPKFRVIENVANALKNRIQEDSPLRESEWDTLRETVLQAGQIQGINRLIQELYAQAHNDKV